MSATAPKRISKSTLSMFLRVKCDRELYLSLHTDSTLATYGLPSPVQARPSIGVLKRDGIEFEAGQNIKLIDAFGAAAICDIKNGKPATAALEKLLTSSSTVPRIVLQGTFSINAFQDAVLKNLGVAPQTIGAIPPIASFIPDIVLVREAHLDDTELTVSGARQPVKSTEVRQALCIIDVKNVVEGNPSYASEIALYALMLANWLHFTGLDSSFFVSGEHFLWTRCHEDLSEFEVLRRKSPVPSNAEFCQALLADSENANLRFFIPTVLRFFQDDLPRVIQTGDSDWRRLDWHVDQRCASCDWLGLEVWAKREDKEKIAANPEHYCLKSAKDKNHLSRLIGMSRGGRKTLEGQAINDTLSVEKSSGAEQVYGFHSLLKRERTKLPQRARALHAETTQVDENGKIVSLARFYDLQICVTINFDASAGLITGMAATAHVWVNKGSRQNPEWDVLRWKPTPFLVNKQSPQAEWVALEGFLSQMASYIDTAKGKLEDPSKAPRTQIVFWDYRQFEELCQAMGRHLPKVLKLSQRTAKALAWMFPPEELLERESGAVSPCIAFIEPIIRRLVYTPNPHVVTLFNTAETYYSGDFKPRVPDSYYREYLGDGIPKERISEIWSGHDSIVRGSITKPRTTVEHEYSDALQLQAAALDRITDRIRRDFKERIITSAQRIDGTIPAGARDTSFDGKLWVWWDELEHATDKAFAKERLCLEGGSLEASYEAIHLVSLLEERPNGERVYQVSPESTEVKFDDGQGYLAVGLFDEPGFPLEKVCARIPKSAPAFTSSDASEVMFMTIGNAIRVTLISFDRDNLQATVKFNSERGLLEYLTRYAGIDWNSNLFLTPGVPTFNWAKRSKAILKAIGNPDIATPDPQSAIAMGKDAIGKPGVSPIKPVARILWRANEEQSRSAIQESEAVEIADYVAEANSLNPDQKLAVKHSVWKGLTVVWGPPGTGKTQTLSSVIHGLVRQASSEQHGIKILVTGPTYKAMEEVLRRAIECLNADSSAPANVFAAYSSAAVCGELPEPRNHLTVTQFRIEREKLAERMAVLHDSKQTVIVGTVAQQADTIADALTGAPVGELFDVVILDEASQIPVTKALAPLGTLKTGGRVIVAGDHLQMPPIQVLEPPVGSEYLVGSIQTYLLNRSFDTKVVSCNLTINYRSGKRIVDYARTLGYPPSLTAYFGDTQLAAIAPLPDRSAGYPAHLPYSAAWADALSPSVPVCTLLHHDEISSQGNRYEAQIVAGLVYSARTSFAGQLAGREKPIDSTAPQAGAFWKNCIGIVTPHRAQRALILRELRELFPHDSADDIAQCVDTVEKFQGGERHTIIVSYGVGDGDVIAGEEAFLMQLERTNVAISRAMAKCIVIMPGSLAGHVPLDKRALQTAFGLKGYVDEFCSESKEVSIEQNGAMRRGTFRWAP